MASTPTLPNKLTHCPMCGDELPAKYTSQWWLHLCICGIDIGGQGPITCCCGVRFLIPHDSFAFSTHLETVEHDWPRILVTNAMERF